MKEKRLCKCGCGIEVSWNSQKNNWNTFLKGHCNRGKIGIIPWNKGKKGIQNAWNRGLTKETDERVLKISKNIGKNKRGKTYQELYGKRKSEDIRNKQKNSLLKWYQNPKNKSKHQELLNLDFVRKKNSDSHIKYYSNPENKEKFLNEHKFFSKMMINKWKDPAYVKNQKIGRNLRPNKPETLILNILNEMFPNEWKYTGDFSFMVNGKNPDFTNVNGQKKLIEFFGDYYHNGENPEDRKSIFKEFGWETLVIWENELRDLNHVKIKLYEFHKKEIN
jgi:hypothetical protein